MTILTVPQARFLREFFACFLGRDFCLGGGTGLAEFYLQHRLSQDLDFFTINQEITFDTVNAEILKIISHEGWKIENQITSATFLRYILNTGGEILKTDFVKDVPIQFGEIKTFNGVRVDSLENITVGKLLALFGRADPKDFVDLYFVFEQAKRLKFKAILEMAKKKDLGLQEIYLAEMIHKVEAIKLFPPTLKEFNKTDLIRYFILLGDDLLKQIQPAE